MLQKTVIVAASVGLLVIEFLRIDNFKAQNPTSSSRAKGLGIEFVRIQGGTFEMGGLTDNPDNLPAHTVTLSDYEMAKYEITVGQFRVFVEATEYQTTFEKYWQEYINNSAQEFLFIKGVSWKKPGFPQTDKHPVTCVTWLDATAFCEWLSQELKQKIRLPTEAEWEYAARSRGEKILFCWGNTFDGRKLNFADKNTNYKRSLDDFDDGFPRTAPVGSFPPNALGLYDMAGNVYEWCQDWYGEYSAAEQTNPIGPPLGNFHIVRGGAWISEPTYCQTVHRDGHYEDRTYTYYGFRVARSVR
ncbi:formylglycine-generating enzyme family protein [candidate division KSB1 bacterium]|nr:formylglycine-generating enzyme family protein [candidate division KSB1 bacterium]